MTRPKNCPSARKLKLHDHDRNTPQCLGHFQSTRVAGSRHCGPPPTRSRGIVLRDKFCVASQIRSAYVHKVN